MPEKVKTARLCLIVAGGLKLATAALMLFIFVIGAAFVGWSGERFGLLGSTVLGALGIVIFLSSALLGIVDIIAATAVGRGQVWGRVLGIVLGILMLPLFPVGTVLGIFILIGLLGPDAPDWFGQGRRATSPMPRAMP
jgi:predicted Na+-dependent transporter